MDEGRAQDIGILILRVGIALIVLYYGCQQMLGLLGGPGFGNQLKVLEMRWHIGPLFGALSIFALFFGALGMLLGILTRVSALGVSSTMAVVTYLNAKRPDLVSDIFLGDTASAPELFYPAALCVASLSILVMGGGGLSFDNKVFGGRGRKAR